MATCIRCGKNCNDGETMCNECKAWFQQKTGSKIPGAERKQSKQDDEIKAAGEKKTISIHPKILGTAIAVLVVVVVSIAAVLFLSSKKQADHRETNGIFENADTVIQSEDKNDGEYRDDVVEGSDIDNNDVEEQVAALNQMYRDQIKSYSDSDDFQSVSVGGNICYYLDDQLVEIDVENSQGNERYSKKYYFKDRTLYYASLSKSSDLFHELYFDSDMLIRWKDVDGINHDRENDSAAFNEWYDYQTEAYDLFFMYEDQDSVKIDISEEFVFPNSDKEYLSESDLEGLSVWEIRVGRNEIMARHGRKFKDEELQNYFNSCSWYEGTMEPETFDSQYDNILNEYEKSNANLIKDYENR